jgi:hypothetical protein
MSGVMVTTACDVLPEAQPLVPSPERAAKALEILGRDRATEPHIVLAEHPPDSESCQRVGIERRETRLAQGVVGVDPDKRRVNLGEDKPEDHGCVHLVEQEVTYDHVGRPFAGRRSAVETFGRDPLDEAWKDDQAVCEDGLLLCPSSATLHSPPDVISRPASLG